MGKEDEGRERGLWILGEEGWDVQCCVGGCIDITWLGEVR